MSEGHVIRVERRAERFRFERPIPALYGSHAVMLRDLSTIGAGIIHREQFVREEAHPLTFTWEGVRIEMASSVVRTTLERQRHGSIALTVYHSGVAFGPADDSMTTGALAARLAEVIARQKANAFAIPIERARDLPVLSFDVEEDAATAASLNLNDYFSYAAAPRFIQCRLIHGCWVHETVESIEQPVDGFTISASETVEGLETLCRTYQHSDQQGRDLIRTFAHLTLTDPGATPRDLYSG